MDPEKKPKGQQVERRYKQLIALIGDFGFEKISTHIQKLSVELSDSDDSYRSFIIGVLSDAVSLFPHKGAIYSAVLKSVYSSNSSLVRELFDKVTLGFQDSINKGDSLKAQNILKFLGESVIAGLLEAECFMDLLNKIVLGMHGLSEKSRDYLHYILIHVLIFVGRTVTDSNFWMAFDSINNYRQPSGYKLACRVAPNSDKERITILAERLQELRTTNWECDLYSTFFTPEPVAKISQLPVVALHLNDACKLISPIFTSFFSDVDVNNTEHMILSEICRDLINALYLNTELLAEKLHSLDYPGPIRSIIIQTLLQEMLNLPDSKHPSIIYWSVILKLSQMGAAEQFYTPEIYLAWGYILKNIEEFDLEASSRFEYFLAFYIQNKDLQVDWRLFLEKELNDYETRFLKATLAKLTRLAYVDKVKNEVPDRLIPYLPPESEPVLKYAMMEDSVDNTDCQLIIDRINSKASAQAMKTLLSSKEICNSGEFLQLIFCQCIFFQGSKSLMHINTYLERYADLIKPIKSTIILEALLEVWPKSAHITAILTQKLMNYKFITQVELVQFAISRLSSSDSWGTWNELEWEMMEQAIKESTAEETFEVVETITRGVAGALLSQDLIPRKATGRKLVELLRRHISSLNQGLIEIVENILPPDVQALWRSVSLLVERT